MASSACSGGAGGEAPIQTMNMTRLCPRNANAMEEKLLLQGRKVPPGKKVGTHRYRAEESGGHPAPASKKTPREGDEDKRRPRRRQSLRSLARAKKETHRAKKPTRS